MPTKAQYQQEINQLIKRLPNVKINPQFTGGKALNNKSNRPKTSKAQKDQNVINKVNNRFQNPVPTMIYTPSKKKNSKKRRSVANPGVHPFTMCRIKPFAAMGKSDGIVDASEIRRILVDHRQNTTFTFGTSGVFHIAITPSVPTCVWANVGGTGDTAAVINGALYTQNTTQADAYVPINLNQWNAQAIANNNSSGNYNDLTPLYSASKFRIVSVGWSITFISAAINATGLINATPVQMSFTEPGPAVTGYTVLCYANSTNVNYSSNQNYISFLEQMPQFGFMNQFSRVFPLAGGCHGILHHQGDEYEYQKLHAFQIIPMAAQPLGGENEQQSLLMYRSGVPTTVGAGGFGISGFDQKWDSTLLTITGGTQGQSFVLDLLYCIEYAPGMNDPTYPLAKASPKEQRTVLQRTRQLADQQPVAEAGGVSTAAQILHTTAQIASVVAGL